MTLEPRPEGADLRRRAELRLPNETPHANSLRSGEETERLLHELQVHQIELEMQNEELRESRLQLEKLTAQMTDLYDFAPIGYVTLGVDGVIKQANLAAAELIETERAQMVGRKLASFVLDMDRRAFKTKFMSIFDEDCPQTFDVCLKQKSGAVRIVQIRATRTPDAQECRAALIEITEQSQAQSALRESDQRFRAVIEALQEGFTLETPDEGVVLCNQSAWRILGLTHTQLMGRLMVDPQWRAVHEDGTVFPNDEFPAAVTMRDGIAQSQVVMGFDKPNGDLVWISVNSVPLNHQSLPRTVAVTFTDITDRKRIEKALAASQLRMEQLSRQLLTTRETELQALSRELHDEIGQLLTVMRMNLRRTQSLVDDEIRGRLDENISLIDQGIGRVRDLSLRLQPPHLKELGLVAALHWYLRHQGELTGIEIHLAVGDTEIDIPKELGFVCFRITQEAITNAIRHANMARAEVELRRDANQLVLTISDDGRGFDVDAAFERAAVGGSLGLINMSERARLAGGDLKVTSAPGAGTKIYAWFPFLPQD
ncbi:PAS domain-containing sensor histidine kinase [Schlesneria paludicola]|uniref:PAS domain-containing sensor histidine kinase n=1 Tax=Schlesneria paludicola TaxID=360056 RepID=UPI00029A939F|nr:PAS domain-containing sensor histidine kinase [Schlesneria paludicola]